MEEIKIFPLLISKWSSPFNGFGYDENLFGEIEVVAVNGISYSPLDNIIEVPSLLTFSSVKSPSFNEESVPESCLFLIIIVGE